MSFALEPEPPGQRVMLVCDACTIGSTAHVPATDDADAAFLRLTSMPWRFLADGRLVCSDACQARLDPATARDGGAR